MFGIELGGISVYTLIFYSHCSKLKDKMPQTARNGDGINGNETE